MAIITGVANQKGGVGKTTTTVNLGKNLAVKGFRVLLVDNDPQGNLTMSIFGDDLPELMLSAEGMPGQAHAYNLYNEDSIVLPFEYSENLHIIGCSKHLSEISTKPFEVIFDFKEKVEKLAVNYDFVIIDCLPSFGALQTAAQMTADNLLIPTHLDDFSVKGIEEQLKTAASTKKRLNNKLNILGILANEVSRQKILVECHFLDQLKDKYDGLLFNTQISKSAKIKESHALRQSIFEYMKNSDQAKQFMDLTDEYLERCGVRNV